jgi:hypothetical protein
VRQKVYRIDDNVVADEERGWLVADDFYKIMKEMDEKVHPFVMVQIDGIPCAGRGCCQGTMMLRPKGSDVDTLVHMIDEYSEFLAILPWAPTTILEGGYFPPTAMNKPPNLQSCLLPMSGACPNQFGHLLSQISVLFCKEQM